MIVEDGPFFLFLQLPFFFVFLWIWGYVWPVPICCGVETNSKHLGIFKSPSWSSPILLDFPSQVFPPGPWIRYFSLDLWALKHMVFLMCSFLAYSHFSFKAQLAHHFFWEALCDFQGPGMSTSQCAGLCVTIPTSF